MPQIDLHQEQGLANQFQIRGTASIPVKLNPDQVQNCPSIWKEETVSPGQNIPKVGKFEHFCQEAFLK